jgi:hypothetical protein
VYSIPNTFSHQPSVRSYSVSSGTLQLEQAGATSTRVTASVDVQLVLERLRAEQTCSGAWVNVLGNITFISEPTTGPGPDANRSTVSVQALLLWSAGAVDMQQYQASVDRLLLQR